MPAPAAIPFLLPILLQVVFGMTAFASGLLTFATAAGSMTMKATARPILRRFGFRNVLIFNTFISAATIAMCAFFTSATPALLMFVLLLIGGFFQSLQNTATQVLAYADMSNPQMSTATSVASMAQQLSKGFGIAVVAVVLHASLAWRGTTDLATVDFYLAFAGATIMALLSLGFGAQLPADAASELSGHRPASKVAPT